MTVNDVYVECCDTLMEGAGLVLGIITEQDFLDYFSDVIQDWCQQTGVYKKLVALPVAAGTSQYTVPDFSVDVQESFYAHHYLSLTPALDMDSLVWNWRTKTGTPQRWHEDRLTAKKVEITPIPTATGSTLTVAVPFYGTLSTISGGDFDLTMTAPLYGTLSVTTGPDYWETDGPLFGTISDLATSSGNLLLCSTAKPPAIVFTLLDVIQCVSDSFVPYLKYGILAKIWSNDGELKDTLRARYAQARYQEGISLAQAIAQELVEEV
jgi:hypothetical protein